MEEPFAFCFPSELQHLVTITDQTSETEQAGTQYASSRVISIPQLTIYRKSLSGFLFFTEVVTYNVKEPVLVHTEVKQPFISFVYVLEGEIDILESADTGKVTMVAGSYFARYLPKGHYPMEIKAGKRNTVYFSLRPGLMKKVRMDYPALGELIDKLLNDSDQPLLMPSRTITSQVKKQLFRLISHRNKRTFALEAEMLKIIKNLIDDYIEKLQTEERVYSRSNGEIAQAVKTYIKAEITRGSMLQVSQIGTQFKMETRTLGRIFKNEFGLRLHQEVLSQQMKTAHRMLQQEEMMVKQITYMLGYSEVASFSRAFSKFFNYPPSEARDHPEDGLDDF